MTRYTGKDLTVYINSMLASYSTGWSMDWDDQTVDRFGVGDTMPTPGEVFSRRAGSFECEGDPGDGVQATLLAGVTEAPLLLVEITGAWHTIPNARIKAGASVTRGGKPMRRFQWIEIPA